MDYHFWGNCCAMNGCLRLPGVMWIVCCVAGTVLTGGVALPQDSPAAPRDDRWQALGIRRLESRHLVLYTDLESAPEVDELPQVFDLAVPAWCDYFAVPPESVQQWRPEACIMRDKARFSQAGLLPDDLPPFLQGYERLGRLWVYEQPSGYYRRHLLLHEGTHSFMQQHLGGAGPPWYMEGMAEYLATHRWEQGQLRLAYMPGSTDEVPFWGRIKIIKREYAAGRPLSLIEVMKYGPQAHLRVEPYAWCWAATLLLDQHPDYQPAFRECRAEAGDSSVDFSRAFYRKLEARWPEVELNWLTLVANMEYGYDLERARVRLASARPVPEGGASCQVRADLGWQSSGLMLVAGQRYQLQATGRYQIADQPRIWWCEPNGVTIRYYQQRPLGMLLAALVPDGQPEQINVVIAAGPTAELAPPVSGTLFLKINESAAALGDNRGELQVQVAQEPTRAPRD